MRKGNHENTKGDERTKGMWGSVILNSVKNLLFRHFVFSWVFVLS